MNLEQLRARLAAILSSMETLVSAEMNDEQTAEFDKLQIEAEKVKANIARLEKFEAEKTSANAGQGRKTQASAPAASFSVRDNRQDDPNAGFRNLAEFGLAVHAASNPANSVMDERLKVLGAPSGYHREASSGDGYLVPEQQSQQIMDLVFSEPDLLSMVSSEDTIGNSVQFLSDETTPWGATGIKAYWGPEAGQMTRSRMETESQQLRLHKLHAFAEVTEELLEDAPRLNGRLTTGAARAINWKANEAILLGDGVAKPLGFNNAGCKVTVAKETSQTAATINATNIAKMYSRSLNPGRSVWLVNQDILPQLITMTIGNQPIYTAPNEGIKGAPGGLLLGRPIMFTDNAQTLGTEGDIMLVDPMGYYLIKKAGGIRFNASVHLLFDYDVQAFKWTFRIGGQPILSAAVSPKNGSNTRSSFITLATRA